MLLLLIVLIVLAFFSFGGWGYGYYRGGAYANPLGILGIILLIGLLILLFSGGWHTPYPYYGP